MREEIRLNAYVLENEGTVIGTFNSRQLKPHREAKLKPDIQINMLQPEKPVATIRTKQIRSFVIDLDKEIKTELSSGDEIMCSKPNGNSTPKGFYVADDEAESTTVSQEMTQGNLRRKKRRGKISEKGMRHISRITNLIYGKKQIPFTMGLVQGQMMKILMDTRGEFNVITKKAVQLIENNNKKLDRISGI